MALSIFRPERYSVSVRLFVAILGPSFLVLLVATVAALISDVIALRSNLERRASIDAELLSKATRPSVGIGDTNSANLVFEALGSNPDVLAAAIYQPNNKLFVEFHRHPAFVFPERPRSGQFGAALDVSVPIKQGEEQIATVFLEVSLARFYDRLKYYSLAVIVALVLLTGAAAALARLLQRRFSEPLENLADTARKISGEQNYSVRAPVFAAPEFEALTQAFNHMLDRIERQNQALTDRTVQLEQANTELTKTNKELEAFTYTVSHDLRTPLRAISSYSQLLQEDLGDQLAPASAEFMERIQKNAVKMAQLIDELLAFSRLDAHPLEKTQVNVEQMVRQVWQDLLPQTESSPARLDLGELPTAEVDPVLIRQVFANLLGNALKYSRTRAKPVVQVSSFAKDGERIYSVRDNGVGFNMRYAGKLFGIFQRLHSDHEFEGTGVGLAIVHRIITRHGGRIWADSEPDKGATFSFTLEPRAAREQKDGNTVGRR